MDRDPERVEASGCDALSEASVRYVRVVIAASNLKIRAAWPGRLFLPLPEADAHAIVAEGL
jgi:hypothetical protein